jgi:hypothetical protein
MSPTQEELAAVIVEQNRFASGKDLQEDVASRRGSGGGSLAAKIGESLKERKEKAALKEKAKQKKLKQGRRPMASPESSSNTEDWPRRPCGVWPTTILKTASATAADCCR